MVDVVVTKFHDLTCQAHSDAVDQSVDWVAFIVDDAHQFPVCLGTDFRRLFLDFLVLECDLIADFEEVLDQVALFALDVLVAAHWLERRNDILKAFIGILLLEHAVLFPLVEHREDLHKDRNKLHRLESLALGFKLVE